MRRQYIEKFDLWFGLLALVAFSRITWVMGAEHIIPVVSSAVSFWSVLCNLLIALKVRHTRCGEPTLK